MRVWQCLSSVQLALVVVLAGGFGFALVSPVWAQQVESDEFLVLSDELNAQSPLSVAEIPQLSELEQPATTIEDWVAQIEASLVQITGVRVETTEAGLQIVLETAEGRELATPTTQTVGNALIADIPNAVLVLPEGGAFEQFAPAEGIALVSVTNEPGNRVRVAITGTDAPPVAEVTATGLAVTLGEAIVGAEDDAIQVVVTGEQDGYRVPNASSATRTDTPIRDIPSSIQVVPRQVIEDRGITNVGEALQNTSGTNGSSDAPNLRGFSTFDSVFVNGTRRGRLGFDNPTTDNIERIEVLKGPASVLFGQGSPGGIINLVTKEPLSEPY
jgi:iron complex outermembrane receptor protein